MLVPGNQTGMSILHLPLCLSGVLLGSTAVLIFPVAPWSLPHPHGLGFPSGERERMEFAGAVSL